MLQYRSTYGNYVIYLSLIILMGLISVLSGQDSVEAISNGDISAETVLSESSELITDIDSLAERSWEPVPSKAALYSLICPGGGQFYNKKIIKGCFVIGLEAYILYNILSKDDDLDRLYDKKFIYEKDSPEYIQSKNRYDDLKSDRNLLIWVMVGAHILGIADSYVDAHLYSFDSIVADDPVSIVPEVGGFSLKVNFTF